jgi:DNA repair photolyase
MALTKSKGNMYDWTSDHWNPIKGKCRYKCPYCYVPHSRAKKLYSGALYLDEKDLKTYLGRDKIIFVGSMTDMWGAWIPNEWRQRIISRCLIYPENEYVFQSKNPGRFIDFQPQPNFLYGTTMETDQYPEGFNPNVPSINARFAMMKGLAPARRRFITIEPIMEFDLYPFVEMIRKLHPEFVTIGADSKKHNLIEPGWHKIQALIEELTKFTEIRHKPNLERLRGPKDG